MTSRLVSVELDDSGLPPPTPEIEQERNVAIYALLEDNTFALAAHPAAQELRLHLSIKDRRLVFALSSGDDAPLNSFHLSLSPLRQVIKDYFAICESYFDAVKRLPAAQIEAIDMGRRGIHDEGSRLLAERLEGKVALDQDTARRLFTLICVLHFRG